jgi:hypothetical protein
MDRENCGGVPGLVPHLGRCRGVFEFVSANELITFHRNRNLKLRDTRRNGWLQAPQYLAKTANSHRRIAARERDHILDAPANFDICRSQKADATRTDVARFFGPVHLLIAQLDNLQRELEPVPLSAPLFQDPYTVLALST